MIAESAVEPRCHRQNIELSLGQRVPGMAKQPRDGPRSSPSKCRARTEDGSKAIDAFRKVRDDHTSHNRYLEVVEEMLRQRENNGRDRDESAGAAKRQ